jgi:hypothetical protein
MTVLKVSVEKHETRAGWFKMTIISTFDILGQTKIELLLRHESLRAIREGADRALSNRPPLNTENLFSTEE